MIFNGLLRHPLYVLEDWTVSADATPPMPRMPNNATEPTVRSLLRSFRGCRAGMVANLRSRERHSCSTQRADAGHVFGPGTLSTGELPPNPGGLPPRGDPAPPASRGGGRRAPRR